MTVDGAVVAEIGAGLLVLLGVARGDAAPSAEWLAGKIAALRIFPDTEGKMNRSVIDAGGEVLVVSQFTLFGDVSKGTRPSFNDAAPPDVAVPLYELFTRKLEAAVGRPVKTGKFGADMQVELLNDGPVTLVIDR